MVAKRNKSNKVVFCQQRLKFEMAYGVIVKHKKIYEKGKKINNNF